VAGSGIVVIDMDPRNGGNESLQALAAKGRVMPAGPRVRTGNGGAHHFFRFDPRITSSKNKLGAGIDVKSAGGYVVAAPSWTRKSDDGPGGHYVWEVSPFEVAIPRMPLWPTTIRYSHRRRARCRRLRAMLRVATSKHLLASWRSQRRLSVLGSVPRARARGATQGFRGNRNSTAKPGSGLGRHDGCRSAKSAAYDQIHLRCCELFLRLYGCSAHVPGLVFRRFLLRNS
jgi:hypothetical protein